MFGGNLQLMDGYRLREPAKERPNGFIRPTIIPAGMTLIHVCSGCQRWQVEFEVGGMGWGPQVEDAEVLATEHRAECPALDMLAGFAGVPVRDRA